MDKKNSIVIYQAKDGKIELRADIEKDTIWATQNQISDLFGTQRPAITKHFKNIFSSGELEEKSVSSILEHTAQDSKKYKVKFYNLDAILSIGYRVNSKKATQFRIWATGVLREYLKNGYALQKYKLIKNPKVIEGLNETLALITSHKLKGKLKGRLTFKITKNMDLDK
jgi:hypothetical protein